jgi:hypothetical protein
MSSAFQLGIFAKYWEPGGVKTRLARDIGQEAAATLQREFFRTLVHRFGTIAATRVVRFAPPDRRAEFASLTGGNWQLEPQSAGDLGHRMADYFRAAFQRGCERVVLIGSDSPTLPPTVVTDAFERLATDSVVLGPSADGGYYLVGAAGSVPPIFGEVEWSTGSVWDQTRRQLAAARIPYAQLPLWYDVDNVDDLRRLAAELQQPADEELRKLVGPVNAALETRL